MKDLKDWTKAIADLGIMDADAVQNTYSEMLATAHDIGFKVPDAQLIETEDPVELRKVIPPLHEGLMKYHAAAKAEATTKEKASAKTPKAIKQPKNPAKTAAKKAAPKEKTMAKTAKAAVAPKKAAKAAKPAKKAKKAAKANARTGVSRNPFADTAVIKVLNKENPARADSERGKRIAAAFKMNGKKVADFYKLPAPMNRTDTLRFLIDRKFISVK